MSQPIRSDYPQATGIGCLGSVETIAIVGIGCRFPGGAADPASFWRVLRDGVDAISEIPPDRWSIEKYFDADPTTPGKTNARWGGFVENIDTFDAAFFRISPREAARMDPQQRLLLEVAWEALEDAGLIPRRCRSDAGVFIGLSSMDYTWMQQGGELETIDAHTNTGGAMSIAANRISFCFDFSGPSVAVDTACSSSLVAVHEACQSLADGRCSTALAGGVNILIKPEPYIGFTRLSMLAPDGRCKAFDASADGFVRSEGAGLVVLKRLADAQRDGDRIYCTIRGTAVNQDGHTSSLTVPSQEAQEELLREAYRRAKVEPAAVQFVEAHGTGTMVGDPIEAMALGRVLSEGRSEATPCGIGSVKTNIGHLEPAAGIAGLIKTALALYHGVIPPNLHFKQANPAIPLDELQLRVPQAPEPWNTDRGLPLAGVNSFGFGGTNAHAVLQAPPPVDQRAHTSSEKCQRLVPLSAHKLESLQALAKKYSAYLQEAADNGDAKSLDDIQWSLINRRTHHAQRLAVVAADVAGLQQALASFSEGERHHRLVSNRQAAAPPKLAFVCSGQGPQWWAMGRELLAEEPVFRGAIEDCDQLLQQLGSWSLLTELGRDEESSRIHETSISQPAIFAIQVALAKLWQSWGIEPEAVVGHSVGEVAAAYLTGVLDLEDAVRVIFHRGRCMDHTSARGKMLAVAMPESRALAYLEEYQGKVSLAAVNSFDSVTLSGEGEVLDELAARLDAEDIWCKFLRVQYAFHSPQMDPLREELLNSLADITPKTAELPLYSTVTASLADGSDWNADYWWRNVREGVQFAPTIDQLFKDGYDTFLELAPHPVLASYLDEIARQRGRQPTIAHSLKRGDGERSTMLMNLGVLYTRGVAIDWQELMAADAGWVDLPSYAWDRERYWNESEKSRIHRLGKPDHPLLGQRLDSACPTWQSRLNARVLRYLSDHRVQGLIVLSGTSYLEMALAALSQLRGTGTFVLEEVEFMTACFLEEDEATPLQLTVQASGNAFAIHRRRDSDDNPWIRHAGGRMRLADPHTTLPVVSLDELRSRCNLEQLSGDECYDRLKEFGLEYGPAFRGIERVWRGHEEAFGQIKATDPIVDTLEAYQVHPALLDAAIQVVVCTHDSDSSSVYLPVSIDQLRVSGRPGAAVFSHARIVDHSAKSVVADIRVFGETGQTLVDLRGLRCQAVDQRELSQDARDLVYAYRWRLKPRQAAAISGRSASDLTAPSEVLRSTVPAAQQLFNDLMPGDQHVRLQRQMDRLCTAYLLEAFAQLGVRLQPQEQFTALELADRLCLAERYRQLITRYLTILQDDGVLRRENDTWEVVQLRPDDAPKDIWQQLVASHPSFFAELTLLGRCGQQLGDILRGDVDPLHLIFPDGSLALAEHLYQDSPFLRFYNTLAQRAIAAVKKELPEGRMLRVLEIGAGTGGLTSYVLSKLPSDRVEYVYTDLSNHFFNKAKEKFDRYPFVRYELLDIEQDPLEQGFESHSFDLILASECLHATADLRATCENVRSVLAADGLLLLLEAVEPVRWIDLVFGLTEGWWRFSDRELRPDYPLLPLKKWQALLEDLGFYDFCELSGMPVDQVKNAVILARGPREVKTDGPSIKRGVSTDAVAELDDEEPTAAEQPPIPQPTTGEQSRYLILADRGDVSDRLVQQLELQGAVCVTLGERGEALVAAVRQHLIDGAERGPFTAIIHCCNLDTPTIGETTSGSINASMIEGCLSAAEVATAVSEIQEDTLPRLWLITGGTQSVTDRPEPTQAIQSGAWGLGRVSSNEMPKLRTKMVDLSATASDAEIRSLVEEIGLSDEEDEVCLRGSARYVHRYVRLIDEDEGVTDRRDVVAYRLEPSKIGLLDKLVLRECPRMTVGPGQVEIEVVAAGLNFSDVMKALGIYPGLSDGPIPLGIECSGHVTAIGPDVDNVAVGDEVLAIAPFCFGRFVVTRADLVGKKPSSISFEEAATLPIAFLTAHYAMNHLGHLAEGERVLIHSATGGVGQAAIQLGRRAGAELFATAGSPEKREFLKAIGIEHIMDSRSLAFADEVLEITAGEGVDVVLNSLAGEALYKSLSVLGQNGRFLEIGKRDVYAGSQLSLKPFRKNLSMMAIDLDGLLRDRPQVLTALFQELVSDFQNGSLKPLPHRVFPISNVVSAFRYMSQARHIGKVVISLRDADVSVAPRSGDELQLQANATYLISGGLGGFGLTVADWMIQRGARHMVLMGRRGAHTPEAQAAVQRMRDAEAEVVVAQADVADPQQVANTLAEIRRSMPPLKGVLHAAMVLDDCLMSNLDAERMGAVWGPKVQGAWNLHHQTLDDPLEMFVLFSSMSAIFGIGGQASYASANTVLDSLAFYRQSIGRPAVSVSWGYLADVGFVAQHQQIAERFESMGVRGFTPSQALTLLGQFMILNSPPHVGVMRVDWGRWGDIVSTVGARLISPCFADLVKQSSLSADGGPMKASAVRQALLAADPAERYQMLADLVRQQVAHVLGSTPDKLDMEKPLTDLGLDSLMAVELRNWIEGDLALTLPAVELMRGPTVNKLVESLAKQFDGGAAPDPPTAEPELDQSANQAQFEASDQSAHELDPGTGGTDEESKAVSPDEQLTGGGQKQTGTESTPEDFPAARLGQADLDKLMRRVNG